MNNSSIASLAILKVNWDKGQDYVDNFVPFVLDAVKADEGAITVSGVQTHIRNQFGLQIPQGAISTLLKRVAGMGYLTKTFGVYARTEKDVEADISIVLADALRQQKALFQKLAAFANKQEHTSWSEEDASNALLSYLETEFLPILAAQLNGQPLPSPSSNPIAAHVIVGEFIVEVADNDPETFSFLETITKGHMLATALFIPDISLAAQKFQDLTVYLDTKILLRALGFEGKGLQDYCSEFLTLLYQSNVNLCAFDVTIEEVRRVLHKAEYLLRNPYEVNRSFLVYEYFLESGLSPSDVEVIINNLPRSLQRLRIFVKERPSHIEELGLNEVRFQELLRAEMPDQQEDAIFHDIDCLTAIYRLRKGKISTQIEKCGYIFVTPNSAVAKASAIFFNEHYEQATVPLCINDHTMATLAWVKNPMLDDGLQRNRLIATAYAAIQPSTKLWKQYLVEVERLKAKGDITEDDYHLLRFSAAAKTALVQSTRGDIEAFSEGTIADVIERARAEARRSTEAKLQEETERRLSAESKVRALTDKAEESRQRLEMRLEEMGLSFGRGVTYVMYASALLLLPIGMYQAHSLPLSDDLKSVLPIFLQITLALAYAAAVYSQFTGGTVRGLVRKIEAWSSEWITAALKQILLNR